MVLVIDASNVRTGGGQVHLVELLRRVNPCDYGFARVVVCAPSQTLNKIAESPYIQRYHHCLINGNYFQQWRWRKFTLRRLLLELNAFLFIPGTIRPSFKWPYATMCQNLLPLELEELFRYKISVATVRLLILRYLHMQSYEGSNGTIFLTRYCYNILARKKKGIRNFRIISHGLNHDIFQPVAFKRFSKEDGQYFQLLYVSTLDVYKHQDKVSLAVINLNKKGYKVKVTFVGPAYRSAHKKMLRIVNSFPEGQQLISYKGRIPYEDLSEMYHHHHAFIFASTCETFGMIITEAMALGMPILCTNRSSLKETVGDAALYFDPLDIGSIEEAIIQFMSDEALREKLSGEAQKRAKRFSWEECSDSTFSFLAQTAKNCGF
jgi:glycosyltransferase involved in cell wall biosynthesis